MDDVIRKQGLENAETGGLASFCTDNARAMSNTMKNLPRLGRADALSWVKYWKNTGFL